jgi:flavin-dependent dehydrogenase
LGTVEEKTDIIQDFKNLGKSLNLEVDSKKGAFIPSGNDILLRFNAVVFFIGDSAGLISPLTCEGIYYALLSAKILSDNFNVDYERKMKKAIKKIRHQARYKSLVYNDKIRGFASKLTKNKFLNKLMSRIAKGIL